MRAYVGITDSAWFAQLSAKRPEEVNFWQPGGNRQFQVLAPGELFLFKLHSPRNFIVGGGFFAHSSLLPISLAWETFGTSNGAESPEELRHRVEKFRKIEGSSRGDYRIGCILLVQPFFLPEEMWIPVPTDFSPNIVQGKTYDLTVEPGLSMFERLKTALEVFPLEEREQRRFGDPVAIRPRIGQGTFRVLVTDAYERRCVVTGERVLPVLEAAHVRPYSSGGEHAVNNGLLLRRDLHTLFDRGYVTVTPDRRFEVSRRIREDFENGRDYYALHGKEVRAPKVSTERPRRDRLEWHNENVFLG